MIKILLILILKVIVDYDLECFSTTIDRSFSVLVLGSRSGCLELAKF